MSTCASPGCTAPLGRRNRWGYCPEHAPTAYPCRVDGCTNRVAAYTSTWVCLEHRTMAPRATRAPSVARYFRRAS